MPYVWEEWALRALVGIEAHEVRQVLEAVRRWPRPAHDRRNRDAGCLTIWGRTLVGRALLVAVFHEGDYTWQIIGARQLTPHELATFTRWEQKHD